MSTKVAVLIIAPEAPARIADPGAWAALYVPQEKLLNAHYVALWEPSHGVTFLRHELSVDNSQKEFVPACFTESDALNYVQSRIPQATIDIVSIS